MSERGAELPSAPPLISIKGLRHRWGEGFQLSIERWELPQGERVALIGASGAGKSTLLMLVAGAITPQEGELWVLGAPLHAMSEPARRAWRAQNVGLLAQSFALIEHLSAAENCALPIELRMRPPGERPHQEELQGLFEELQLTTLQGKRPSQLSQGERQRFALARALLGAPPLTLTDEPTAHLDPESTQQSLRRLLRPRELGGVLVVTHDHAQLEGFDSIWRLEEGRLSLTRRASPDSPSEPKPSSRVAAPSAEVSGDSWRGLAKLGLKATRHYWGRSLALALTLALTASLPIGLQRLGARLERRLLERAQSSPLVLGSPGSRFDLTLRSLYFKGAALQPLPWRDLKQVYRLGGVQAAPLHLSFSARGEPLVGTSVEYYELRSLKPRLGRLPQRLGEVTLGARAARRLGLSVGDRLMSDQTDLYNLAATYPVELTVVGVLERAQSPDDDALFTDIKTCWVIEGRGHGHQRAEGQQGAALVMSQRLSGEGAQAVHFHGDMGEYPLSSLLISPQSERAASLFKARAQRESRWHITTPTEVIRELLRVIFKVSALLQLLSQGALALTCALGALIAWLSFTLRAHEWSALALLGLSRRQVAGAGALELAWVALGASLTLLVLLALIGQLEGLVWSLLL